MDRWLAEIPNNNLNGTLPKNDEFSYSCSGTRRDADNYTRYELVFTYKITDNFEEFQGPATLLNTMVCKDDKGAIIFVLQDS